MSGLEAALEELYAADPSEFTKKRDALMKQLKAAGDKEGAASLGARRKPTQLAWVLNQLARREPDAVSELVDVGRELAREQRKALRGDASAGLRDSIERQRKTIMTLAAKTTALMKELGVDLGAHLGEITTALQAALVDPVVGAQLEEGRFEKTPDASVGFGGAIPAEESAPAKGKSEPPKKDHAAEAALKAARAEHAKAVSAAKTVVKEAEAKAKRAHQHAEAAETEAKAATELAVRLTAKAKEAAAVATAAEKELAKLEANAPE